MTAGCVTTKGCCGVATVTTVGWYDTVGGGGGCGGGCCWFRTAAPCVRAPTISDVRLFMFFLYDGEVLGVRIRTKIGWRCEGRAPARPDGPARNVPAPPSARGAVGQDHPRVVRCNSYGVVQREGRACRVRARGGSQFIATVVHDSFTVRPTVGRAGARPSRLGRTSDAASCVPPVWSGYATHSWWTPRAEGGAGTSRAGPSTRRAECVPGRVRGVCQPLTTPPRLRRHGSASWA